MFDNITYHYQRSSEQNGSTTEEEYAEHTYTECPGRTVPDFGRMFLKLKYTDITQNTYIQS